MCWLRRCVPTRTRCHTNLNKHAPPCAVSLLPDSDSSSRNSALPVCGFCVVSGSVLRERHPSGHFDHRRCHPDCPPMSVTLLWGCGRLCGHSSAQTGLCIVRLLPKVSHTFGYKSLTLGIFAAVSPCSRARLTFQPFLCFALLFSLLGKRTAKPRVTSLCPGFGSVLASALRCARDALRV